MVKKQNCVIWIQIVSLYGYKQMIFIKIFHLDKTRFDTSNYELHKPLSKGKNKKVIGLRKDELGGKIITKLFGLRAKTYSYLKDDGSEDKKEKGKRECVIKRKFKFENYKTCLEATQLENKLNRLNKNKISIDSIKKIINNSKEAINQY